MGIPVILLDMRNIRMLYCLGLLLVAAGSFDSHAQTPDAPPAKEAEKVEKVEKTEKVPVAGKPEVICSGAVKKARDRRRAKPSRPARSSARSRRAASTRRSTRPPSTAPKRPRVSCTAPSMPPPPMPRVWPSSCPRARCRLGAGVARQAALEPSRSTCLPVRVATSAGNETTSACATCGRRGRNRSRKTSTRERAGLEFVRAGFELVRAYRSYSDRRHMAPSYMECPTS